VLFRSEEENEKSLAKELATGADIYINDDFATSHRKTASLVAITKLLPSYAGLHLEEEIANLSRARDNYSFPRVVILGGIKLEDKLGIIQKLENKNTKFLLGSAYRLPREALPRHANVFVPQDGIGDGKTWLDIGTKTTKEYTKIITKAKTVIWSGPIGNVENAKYVKGSRALAQAIIKSRAFSVAGGGDTADFLQKENLLEKFNWVSTGGGAMLAFLAGEKMPALQALDADEK
jgi:phosphoglycerate kinase